MKPHISWIWLGIIALANTTLAFYYIWRQEWVLALVYTAFSLFWAYFGFTSFNNQKTKKNQS